VIRHIATKLATMHATLAAAPAWGSALTRRLAARAARVAGPGWGQRGLARAVCTAAGGGATERMEPAGGGGRPQRPLMGKPHGGERPAFEELGIKEIADKVHSPHA
jgi:hypothetical protein